MPRYNSFQEAIDLDKIKPKLKKSMIEQRKREKGGKWIWVDAIPKGYWKLVKRK